MSDLTAQQVIAALANPATAGPVGDAFALATAIEIATAPFGTSSGGFVFKLDQATGLLARTTTTFGPSFTERALTSGEGKVSVGATFRSTTYDELSGFSLSALPVGSVTATDPIAAGTSTARVTLTSQTLAMSGTVGVTDNFDIGVVVPIVSIKLSGTSSLVDGNGRRPPGGGQHQLLAASATSRPSPSTASSSSRVAIFPTRAGSR